MSIGYETEIGRIRERLKIRSRLLKNCRCPVVLRLHLNGMLKDREYLQYLTVLERCNDGIRRESVRKIKELTAEELAYFDGLGGKPAYVAVDGVIYDVSAAPAWGGGTHFGLYSGKDLTSFFKSCHGTANVLDGLERVGILKK